MWYPSCLKLIQCLEELLVNIFCLPGRLEKSNLSWCNVLHLWWLSRMPFTVASGFYVAQRHPDLRVHHLTLQIEVQSGQSTTTVRKFREDLSFWKIVLRRDWARELIMGMCCGAANEGVWCTHVVTRQSAQYTRSYACLHWVLFLHHFPSNLELLAGQFYFFTEHNI